MNVRTSFAQTTIALLSTIGSSANAVAKLVDSSASSVDMLDRMVQRAKQRQHDTHLVEDATWRDNLIDDAAKAQAKRQHALIKEIGSDPKLQQLFTTNQSALLALFAAPAE